MLAYRYHSIEADGPWTSPPFPPAERRHIVQGVIGGFIMKRPRWAEDLDGNFIYGLDAKGKEMKSAPLQTGTTGHATKKTLKSAADRLFIGTFPTGISYADRQRAKDGDYVRIAFLPFSTLELEWSPGKHPPELKRLVARDAAQMAKRKGREYQVSTAGQTVTLGRRGHATKKSPAQLDREIAEALAGGSSSLSSPFEQAKAEQARLEEESEAAGAALQVFPRGPMGLAPDAVRATPEYRAAKARADKAFARLRDFNGVFVKRFAKELRAWRDERARAREKRH